MGELTHSQRKTFVDSGYKNIMPNVLKDRPYVQKALQQILEKHGLTADYYSADFSTPNISALANKGPEFQVMISNSMLKLLDDNELIAGIARGIEAAANLKAHSTIYHVGLIGGTIIGFATAGAYAYKDYKSEQSFYGIDKPTDTQIEAMTRRRMLGTCAVAMVVAPLGDKAVKMIANQIIPPTEVHLDYNPDDLKLMAEKLSKLLAQHPQRDAGKTR